MMTILVALAAILVPLFPNLLRRAHKATDATQTSEVSKAVQLYQFSYIGYPDEWDFMTVATGTTAPNFLPADGGNPFGNAANIATLTTDEVGHLSRVGITSGHHFAASSPGHPTLDPSASPSLTPTPIATTTPVFVITPATTGDVPTEIRNILLRDATAKFVVFGVGQRCTMVGKVMQSAPTSVPQNGDFTPANRYSRVGVLFQVAGVGIDASTGGTKRARFMGAVALEDDELESAEKDLVNYYDISKTGQ